MKKEAWEAHEHKHPGYFLQGFDVKCLKPRYGEKKYFNPETNNWHTDRKYLARELKSIGWTNEQFYLTHGQQWMPDVWATNNTDPQTGNLSHTPTCGCCGKPVKFNQWDYDKFCSFSCSTKWYDANTNRIDSAMATLRERKAENPDHHLRPNQLRYWTNKGLSDEEALEKVRERNAVNSKERYIERAGGDVAIGTAAWADRQERWQESMRKSGILHGYSNRSSSLFDEVKKQVPTIEYGAKEHKVRVANKVFTVDCYHPESNRIIEFYGDYWHANPAKYAADFHNKNKEMSASAIWAYDASRIIMLESKGHEVMIVWESDYANDPATTISKCVLFLTNTPLKVEPEIDDEPLIIW